MKSKDDMFNMKNNCLYIIIAELLPQRRPLEGGKKGCEADCIINKQYHAILVKLLRYYEFRFLSQEIGLRISTL